MKKNITILSAVILLASSTVFTSCKKDDVTPPVVTLNGGDETVSLQGTFNDLGASAKDAKDGNLNASVSGNVDVNHTGTYQLVYTATDAAGNSASATRNVTVVNDLESMSGVYSCVVAGYTYTQTITASSTRNKRIIFGAFGDYHYYTFPAGLPPVKGAGLSTIYADVLGATVTSPVDLPSQIAIQVGNPATDRTFSGTAGARSSATTFSLSYTETTPGTGGSAAFTEVYTKQ